MAFSDVFAGNFMACGIAASNNLTYCWGVGDGGQLGKGVHQYQHPTTPVTTTSDTVNGPFLQIRQVSGGDDGFCALTIDRRLFCWGRLIGTSSVTSPIAAAQTITTGAGSQQILPNSIAMGEQHICLLDLSGSAFCTGSDQHGELGDSALGTSPAVGTFPFVKHTPPQGWANITAGQAFTCGIPRFDPNNAANSQIPRCWGLNTSGQVGNDSTSGLLGQQVPSLDLAGRHHSFRFYEHHRRGAARVRHHCARVPSWWSGVLLGWQRLGTTRHGAVSGDDRFNPDGRQRWRAIREDLRRYVSHMRDSMPAGMPGAGAATTIGQLGNNTHHQFRHAGPVSAVPAASDRFL